LIEEFSGGFGELRSAYPEMLRGRAAEQFEALYSHYVEAGVDPEMASTVAGAHQAYTALGIIQAAKESGAQLMDVAKLYFYMGERLELDWFGAQILSSKVDSEWQSLARDTYLEDLDWQQRTLAVGALRHLKPDTKLLSCVSAWEKQEALLLARWRSMLAELHATQNPDFAMFAVANRELLDLAQSSIRANS
jgi:glutamate dehydrogenase